MEVQVQNREGLFKALTVSLKDESVKKRLEDAYRRIQQTAQIQGFRKGKAPLWIIKAKYKEAVEQQLGQEFINETLEKALEQAKLKPVADIFLEEYAFNEDEGSFTYRVSFEVPPEFELKKPEQIEVKVPKVEFKPELVEQRLESLRRENAYWEPKEKDEPAQEGDLLVLEYEVRDRSKEGETVKEETSVVLGQGVLRPEAEEALKGKKVGEEVLLEDLPLYDQTGKEVGRVDIKVKVKEIKKQVLPELNDEFAKELGYDSLEELKKKTEEEVKKSVESLKKQLLLDRLADELLKLHSFPAPKTLVRRELELLLNRRLRELAAYGVDPRYVDVKKLAKELEPVAENNVRLRIILDRYADELGVEVTDEELEKQYEQLAQEQGLSKEEIKKLFREQGYEEVVHQDARRNKTLEQLARLVKLVEIKEEEKKDEKAS
ncbi:MAG: trigger factor [Aquificae bacterium]|nr:trigger factor [Aquificota bacterium]